ncbi:hypothetical protein O6H91_21G030800 [Diphasiastrum complanatum]|uniref:Uncharacterized protein n=1 Tax=Diphasiastrum complanatum TaxID=34168 RepID=A0ACC2AJJ1_DIPCM|nr:hypothetical protein O6H91_21G030800 [Diphasiastrum complanatum]
MKATKMAAAALVLLAFLTMSPQVRSAADCNAVASSLMPCLPYLMGSSSYLPTPQSRCCGVVKQLNWDQACKCLVERLHNAPGWLNVAKAQAIPGACGLNLDTKSCS